MDDNTKNKSNIPATLQGFVDYLESTLPRLCTPADLVEAGIFNTMEEFRNIRYRGDGPDYIKISPRNYRYTREAIIEWVIAAAQDTTSEQKAATG